MHNSESPIAPINPIEEQADVGSPPIPRPGSVTILVLGVLMITVINLVRLVLCIRYWDFLTSWPGISPLYMASTGFIWTLAGSLLLWGLWRAKMWAPRLMEAVALIICVILLAGSCVPGRSPGKRGGGSHTGTAPS